MDVKSTILVLIIILLLVAAGYLTYVISDGSDPLVLLDSFAQDEQTPEDPLLEEELLAQNEVTPSPTVEFTSTSPTPTTGDAADASETLDVSVTVTVSPSPTATLTPTPTPLPTELPETGGGTPAVTLPVAGVGDYLNPLVFGGGILVLLALML